MNVFMGILFAWNLFQISVSILYSITVGYCFEFIIVKWKWTVSCFEDMKDKLVGRNKDGTWPLYNTHTHKYIHVDMHACIHIHPQKQYWRNLIFSSLLILKCRSIDLLRFAKLFGLWRNLDYICCIWDFFYILNLKWESWISRHTLCLESCAQMSCGGVLLHTQRLTVE